MFKNSETDLKRDLRLTEGLTCPRDICLDLLGEYVPPKAEIARHEERWQRVRALIGGDPTGEKAIDLAPTVYVGRDVSITLDLAGPGADRSVGLINVGGDFSVTGDIEALEAFKAQFEAMGVPAKDVIVIGHRGSGKLNMLLAFMSAQAKAESYAGACYDVLAYDEMADLHPGERYRKVQREQHSKRSRAGKAARWA